ncbi:MAG: zinc-ribbon domain-containing protein [Lachnospiraceae bacterium]|nr:zinc-ribbon domain-containing protein [Lachnospiraceae bacterium]
MDFFNKVGSTISSKSKDVTKKAKELAEIAKLTGQIAEKEESVKGAYIELGKYVYEAQKEDAPEEVAEKFAVIDATVEEIDHLKREIRKLKGRQECPDCGKEVSYSAAFCSYCGAKLPEPEPEEVVEEGDVTEVTEEAAAPETAPAEEAAPAEETVKTEEI